MWHTGAGYGGSSPSACPPTSCPPACRRASCPPSRPASAADPAARCCGQQRTRRVQHTVGRALVTNQARFAPRSISDQVSILLAVVAKLVGAGSLTSTNCFTCRAPRSCGRTCLPGPAVRTGTQKATDASLETSDIMREHVLGLLVTGSSPNGAPHAPCRHRRGVDSGDWPFHAAHVPLPQLPAVELEADLQPALPLGQEVRLLPHLPTRCPAAFPLTRELQPMSREFLASACP